MIVLAVYGCWRGHSNTKKFAARGEGLIPNEILCGGKDGKGECDATAFLFDTMEQKPTFTVVKGGKE